MDSANTINAKRKQALLAGVGVLTLALASPFLKDYLVWSVGQLFYLLLGVSTIRIVHKGVGSSRFGWLALLTMIGFLILKAKVLYLITLVFFILYLVERGVGRMNHIPFFAAVLVWPVTQYVLNALSFPIRLQLTGSVGRVLHLVYPDIAVKGNIIEFAGSQFVVNDACLGLSMFQAAFLMCLFLIGQYERKQAVVIRYWVIGILLVVTTGLVIAANWVRILLTVLFQSMPDTAGHEMLGLASLVVYVLIPIALVIRKFGGRFVQSLKPAEPPSPFLGIAWLVPLFFAYSFMMPEVMVRAKLDSRVAGLEVPGYTKHKLALDVLQFYGEEVLVYVKPGVAFHAADHNPRICWRGSGYRFAGEFVEEIDGHPVVFSQLISPDKQTWYSCWWYDNGKYKTVSQRTWRWKTIQDGKPFRLINVTCRNEEKLKKLARNWMEIMQDFEVMTKTNEPNRDIIGAGTL